MVYVALLIASEVLVVGDFAVPKRDSRGIVISVCFICARGRRTHAETQRNAREKPADAIAMKFRLQPLPPHVPRVPP